MAYNGQKNIIQISKLNYSEIWSFTVKLVKNNLKVQVDKN